MGLLSEIINKQLPRLDATRDLGLHAPALVKFSRPDINWSWYGVEFDGRDTFFGLIAGLAAELGRFRLSELETTCGYGHFRARPELCAAAAGGFNGRTRESSGLAAAYPESCSLTSGTFPRRSP